MKKTLIAVGVLAVLVAYRQFVLVNPLLDQVRAQLSDPDSAQFKNLKLYSNWTPKNSVLCGEVNAKNRMGGYVGFRDFKVFGGANLVDVRESGHPLESAFASGELKWCNFDEVAPWWGVPF